MFVDLWLLYNWTLLYLHNCWLILYCINFWIRIWIYNGWHIKEAYLELQKFASHFSYTHFFFASNTRAWINVSLFTWTGSSIYTLSCASLSFVFSDVASVRLDNVILRQWRELSKFTHTILVSCFIGIIWWEKVFSCDFNFTCSYERPQRYTIHFIEFLSCHSRYCRK